MAASIPAPPLLRPYQETAVTAVRGAMARHRAVLLVSPTGSGKTVMFAYVTASARAKGKRVVVVAHRAEIVGQIHAALARSGVEAGIIAPGQPETDHPVQVAMVQTLARRLDRLTVPDLLVVDEAHHAVCGSYAAVRAAWPNARVLGVTATPERLDGRGLGDVFEVMVEGPTTADLIQAGFLSPYRAFAPAVVDLTGVKTRMGEYAAGDLSQAVDKPHLVADVVSTYRRLAAGCRGIVFAAGIDHSQHLAEQFRAASITAAHVDGATPAEQRAAAIEAFAAGRTQILTNVELFGEGFDVPAVEAVVLARPTQSLALHLQQIGRALRPAEGKAFALILDHAGNLARHGLPDDPREWSLNGLARRQRKAGEALPTVKVCPSCFCTHRPAAACPECGHQYAPMERKLETREGELAEVRRADDWTGGINITTARGKDFKALLERAAGDIERLRQISRARGYKRGWAKHVADEHKFRKQFEERVRGTAA